MRILLPACLCVGVALSFAGCAKKQTHYTHDTNTVNRQDSGAAAVQAVAQTMGGTQDGTPDEIAKQEAEEARIATINFE